MNIDLELRSLQEKVRAGSVKAEDARKSFDELRAKKAEVEKAEALAAAPIEKRSNIVSFADIRDAMLEKRAIAINGTGAINQVSEIVKLIQQKTPLLGMVKYFYGANASTNIPLLSPGLAAPVAQSEAYDGGSVDSTAVLSSVSITPVAYNSVLPVSWEALNLSVANIESQFPQLFADVYASAMHKTIVDALFHTSGVAAANKIECDAAGLPSVIDLAELAISMQDYMDDAVIVTSPAAYRNALASATDTVGKLYTEELIRSKTIEGVKVILTGFAPVSTTAGVMTAVGGRMSEFGMGVASDLVIQPKQKVGNNSTFFDSFMYFAGKVVQPANLMALKAKASQG
jgi:HK97 family phage major capsid protein